MRGSHLGLSSLVLTPPLRPDIISRIPPNQSESCSLIASCGLATDDNMVMATENQQVLPRLWVETGATPPRGARYVPEALTNITRLMSGDPPTETAIPFLFLPMLKVPCFDRLSRKLLPRVPRIG